MGRHGHAWFLMGAVLFAGSLPACTGLIGDGEGSESTPSDAPATDGPQASYAPIEVRRLSRHELGATLTELLGIDVSTELDALSPDTQTPFDNDYRTQSASASLIEGMNLVARRLGERLLEERAPLEALIPCTPAGAHDAECMRDFVADFGRRALRRPLDQEEIEEYAALESYGDEAGDFLVGAALVVSAMVQDVELLYRVEIGEPVEGRTDVRRLTGYEMATRLSFLLWGTAPDDALLDAAHTLQEREGVGAMAESMLEDPRARAQLARFHALWLDYDQIPLDPTLATSMSTETGALIERVVFDEGRPWNDLFLAEETYVDPALAAHYGLPAMSAPGWIAYPDPAQRRGLLSHGSFLSVGGKFGDTSPVARGKNVLERLLCREIPPPPPDVNADEPPPAPPGAVCKTDRYTMAETDGCSSCHGMTDPLGFGLENYGPDGAWRDVEPDEPSCTIAGNGHLTGLGDFHGSAELGALVAGSDELGACLTRHLYQFTAGRAAEEEEAPLVDDFAATFAEGRDLRALLVRFTQSDSFRFIKLAP
ncbi:MAG: DUF1592 domain-containing protein [Polyangiaceae bacterium]|nr:DUF1592 domain-containing protein [Polyangiaceae bacterium]